MPSVSVVRDPRLNSGQDATRVRRIGFLVYPDVEVLDVCGPLDAFAYADYYLRAAGRVDEPGYEVLVIAASPGPVTTHCGLQIVATHGCADVSGRLDTLIVAGGVDVEAACTDPRLVEWLETMAPRVRRLAVTPAGSPVADVR